MKKVIYISVPITGRAKCEITADIERAAEFCVMKFVDFNREYINPLNIAAEVDRIFKILKLGEPYYGEYMGFDITELIERADTVVFCKDWQQSKGCRLEHAAAEIYKKEIFYL
ncbi:MAG: DUF4406 domain-containing protein [Prevotellaceae bacterium]|jgi:hypothetical protein|nr:DUF4406 domain-containing protein [Prevotellaceae bacterium]